MNLGDIDVKRLSIQHGDVLLVKVPDSMNLNVHGMIRGAFLQAFQQAGSNFVPSVLIIPKEMDVEILRRETAGQDNRPQ